MSFASWLRTLKARFEHARRSRRGSRRTQTRARLSLEQLEDRTVPTTFTVLNTLDSGAGSLRQAILDANCAATGTVANPDVIAFNLSPTDPNHFYYQDDGMPEQVSRSLVAQTAAGDDSAIADIDPDWAHSWWSIQPLTPLCELDDEALIDGYSQTGAQANTLAQADNAILRVELNGSLDVVPGSIPQGRPYAGLRITLGTIQGLAINNFPQVGVWVAQGTVQGNFIGTDVSGTLAQGNAGDAVYTYGGATVGGTTAAARNVISASISLNNGDGSLGGNGISVNYDGNLVQGNFIGTDASGSRALGNAGTGVDLYAAVAAVVGGTAPGAGNVISGNHHGISFGTAGFATVQGNFIGTDATGMHALGNERGIVDFTGAGHNRIGDTTPGSATVLATGVGSVLGEPVAHAGNLISGNLVGLDLRGYGDLVQGNFIGTDVAGAAQAWPLWPLGNSTGINFQDANSGNIVGGTEPGAGNLIAGNGHGVFINSGVRNVVVEGNTFRQNAFAVGLFHAADNRVQSNTFANNRLAIDEQFGSGNQVVDNGFDNNDATIGLYSSSGDEVTLNTLNGGGGGISLDGGCEDNDVGFNTITGGAGAIIIEGGSNRNDIHANSITGSGSHSWAGVTIRVGDDNILHGNIITNSQQAGVWISSGNGNHVENNTITGSSGNGILIQDGTGNAISNNSIHDNDGLGIDLGGDGVTTNDAGDADTGPNNLQNFPVISAAYSGTTTRVVGTMNSLASTSLTLDFYASSVADPSGFGEGQRYLGSASVLTDGSGNAHFDVTLMAATAAGELVTATATGPDGTSEFSAAVEAIQQVQIDVRSESLNVASNGVIIVDLFSTADFNAALVDVSTVLFAGARAVQSSSQDVDHDGDLDLVLWFRTQDTNLRVLYQQLLADDINEDGVLDSNHQTAEVSLTSQVADHTLFQGFDQLDLFLSGKALRDMLAALATAGMI